MHGSADRKRTRTAEKREAMLAISSFFILIRHHWLHLQSLPLHLLDPSVSHDLVSGLLSLGWNCNAAGQ